MALWRAMPAMQLLTRQCRTFASQPAWGCMRALRQPMIPQNASGVRAYGRRRRQSEVYRESDCDYFTAAELKRFEHKYNKKAADRRRQRRQMEREIPAASHRPRRTKSAFDDVSDDATYTTIHFDALRGRSSTTSNQKRRESAQHHSHHTANQKQNPHQQQKKAKPWQRTGQSSAEKRRRQRQQRRHNSKSAFDEDVRRALSEAMRRQQYQQQFERFEEDDAFGFGAGFDFADEYDFFGNESAYQRKQRKSRIEVDFDDEFEDFGAFDFTSTFGGFSSQRRRGRDGQWAEFQQTRSTQNNFDGGDEFAERRGFSKARVARIERQVRRELTEAAVDVLNKTASTQRAYGSRIRAVRLPTSGATPLGDWERDGATYTHYGDGTMMVDSLRVRFAFAGSRRLSGTAVVHSHYDESSGSFSLATLHVINGDGTRWFLINNGDENGKISFFEETTKQSSTATATASAANEYVDVEYHFKSARYTR